MTLKDKILRILRKEAIVYDETEGTYAIFSSDEGFESVAEKIVRMVERSLVKRRCKMIEYIDVNGKIFVHGKDFDDVKVYTPEQPEPYWEIKLLKDGKEVKMIRATGNVAIVYK